jgi:hypothetical protein
VLAEARVRTSGDGRDASLFVPAFEHAFTEATRALRTIVNLRDPKRRLQWNRIALYVAPAIFLDPDIAGPLARRAFSVSGRPSGRNQSSVVFGIITTPTEEVPEGISRVLVLSDPTLDMGALAALDLAEERGIPVEWLPVSSGARIAMDSGTESLDATARVVRRIVHFTENGGALHGS